LVISLTKSLLFLLLLPILSFSNELTACYKAYLFFFPVAESCITYQEKGDTLRVSSLVRTINVGKLVKRVYNRGEALIDKNTLNPISFKYYQEEGEFKRYQEYNFRKGKIYTKEVKYKKLTNEVEKEEEKVYEQEGYLEPYSASLKLYKDSATNKYGTLFMFYDDKKYKIPYSVIGKEELNTDIGSFKTRVIEVSPNVETKGLLKPKGKWYLWIDEDTYLPVKMKLGFVIGSATAVITKIEGDKTLLRRVLK